MVLAISKTDKDEAVDFKGNPVDNSKTGGWLAAGLILGTELSERICVMGISMNLVTYLVGELHLSSSKSANTVTNFMGALNILALFGGFLADAKLGRYLTIAIFASICAVRKNVEDKEVERKASVENKEVERKASIKNNENCKQ